MSSRAWPRSGSHFRSGLAIFISFRIYSLLTNAIIIPLSTLCDVRLAVCCSRGHRRSWPLVRLCCCNTSWMHFGPLSSGWRFAMRTNNGYLDKRDPVNGIEPVGRCIHRWVISGNGSLLLAGLFSVMICLGVQVNVRQQQLSEGIFRYCLFEHQFACSKPGPKPSCWLIRSTYRRESAVLTRI